MPKTYSLPIVSHRDIALGTIEVGFDATGTDFAFVAGQYMRITLESITSDDIFDTYHEFSISSAPGNSILTVTFRTSDRIFKQTLLGLPIGTKVTIEGPLGVFTLPEESNHVTMIAGGIGVTPFRSIVTDSVAHQNLTRLTLLLFNRDEAHTPYLNELQLLTQNNPQFELVSIYDKLTADNIKPYLDADSSYMIAGPPGMVKAARSELTAQEIGDQQIRTEEFSGY